MPLLELQCVLYSVQCQVSLFFISKRMRNHLFRQKIYNSRNYKNKDCDREREIMHI